MEGRMKFTASGDALIMRNFPENYEGYEAVKDFIGQGEARITNLETTLTERDCFPSTFSGGTWLTADPGCLADVARLGFNVLGFANNHTMDYSYGGLEDTLRFLRREGIAAVGAGQNLFEAARPAIV